MSITSANPNVLLVTVDALRADHLTCYGYERPTSPFLDRLAAEGTRIAQCFAAGPNTGDSLPGLLAGSNPAVFSTENASESDRPPSGATRPTLAEWLRSNDYATGAVTGAPGSLAANGFDRGFDRFPTLSEHDPASGGVIPRVRRLFRNLGIDRDHALYRLTRRHVRRVVGYRTASPHPAADSINASVLRLLPELETPWFLWCHFMDVHAPITPRPEAGRALGLNWNERTANRALTKRAAPDPVPLSEDERRCLVNLYDAAIRHLDDRLRDLFEQLGERGALRETLAIVTADHGEELGEHGHFDHATERSGRRPKLYDELLHVPLIVRDFAGRTQITYGGELVSHLDLAPTIAEATVRSVPSGWTGKNLSPDTERETGDRPNPRRIAISRQRIRENGHDRLLVSARSRRWKLIFAPDGGPELLFDLVVDPRERTSLAGRRPEEIRRLRRAVDRDLRTSSGRSHDENSAR